MRDRLSKTDDSDVRLVAMCNSLRRADRGVVLLAGVSHATRRYEATRSHVQGAPAHLLVWSLVRRESVLTFMAVAAAAAQANAAIGHVTQSRARQVCPREIEGGGGLAVSAAATTGKVLSKWWCTCPPATTTN